MLTILGSGGTLESTVGARVVPLLGGSEPGAAKALPCDKQSNESVAVRKARLMSDRITHSILCGYIAGRRTATGIPKLDVNRHRRLFARHAQRTALGLAGFVS